MAKCIQCMEREGDPKNGGLCYVCAPPLKLRIALGRRRRILDIVIKHLP